MEKFQKAYDGLKAGGSVKKKEGGLQAKEKISYCQTITEVVQSQQFKQHPEFAKQFSAAFEVLFSLCDDANSDVRVYVDECLNTIIRNNLSEGNVMRIHCELYQEIKRNGPARCIRSALTKFADLASQIRPNRCRTFAKNLMSPLIAISRRPEEAVQECLGPVMDKILGVLGRFFNDEETKILIKSVFPSLQLQSAASRRTASIFLVELCRNSRKRYTFVSYLFKMLSDTIIPVQLDQSVLQLLGTFFTLRQLLPILRMCEDDDDAGQELRVTQTGTIKLRPSTSLTTEHMLQAYEATLYYLSYPHSSVVTAALETLHQFLIYGPKDTLQILLSETESLGKSRIFLSAVNSGSQLSRSRKGSFSGIRSGMSSLGGSQTDLSSFGIGDLSIDEPNLFPGAPVCSSPLPPCVPRSMADVADDDAPITMITTSNINYAGSANDDQAYSSIQIGQVVDDDVVSPMTASNFEGRIKALSVKELTPLTIAEGTDIDAMNDPISPMSPLCLKDIGFPEDIGLYAETRPPLRYCGRLLCRKFLLNGAVGELIADKDVRVSQKVLALGCLEALCNLYPMVLNDSLLPYSESGQRISDILLFANHDDPQIKGNVAVLAGCWLKSMAVCTGYKMEVLPQQVACDVVQVLSRILADESGIAARLGVMALTKCYGELLKFDSSTCLRLLRQAIGLAKNPYWLLKVEVAELMSTVDYCAVSAAELATAVVVCENERFHVMVLEKLLNGLLADEDQRVRQAASNTAVVLVRKLCLDNEPDQISFVRRTEFLTSAFDLTWQLSAFPPIHCLASTYNLTKNEHDGKVSVIVKNLSYSVDLVIRTLCQAVDKYHMIGCLSALQKMADSFPPSLYESGWCISNSSKSTSIVDLLGMLFSFLRSVPFGADMLVVHQIVFSLISSLFAGAALRDLSASKTQQKSDGHSQNRWPTLTSPQLGEFANDLFNYCLRIVSIYWHVVTEQHPSAPPVLTKPPLPQLPQASAITTPVANKLKAVTGSKSENKGQDKEGSSPSAHPPALPTTKYKASDFYSSIHLMRIFEMVKGAWSNYKINLDAEVEDKFGFLLRSCLGCVDSLLEVATFHDVDKITEEFLAYLKPLMPILPAEVVTTVIQLLKSLFGTNLPMLFQSNQSYATTSMISKFLQASHGSGVYENCILKQRARIYNHFSSAVARHELCAELIKHRGDKHVMALLKNTTSKAALTNYIRLFEPIVVQCLRLYTSCIDVDLQCNVIALLGQLVQIRVNYSLLDTDRRFLEFLLQQLENIEDGNTRKADALTLRLFEFLVLLSYEKYQSSSVVEVPKILQLADGLLASSQNVKRTGYLGILALYPVVLDLYFCRSASKADAMKELEIQQEVVASMLIKCIRCGGGALSLLSYVLCQTKKDNESKWRKLSRDIVDVLMPLVSKNQIPLGNIADCNAILTLTDFLCSSAFRPVDPVLALMFMPPPATASSFDEFCSWSAYQLWCLRTLVVYSNEAAVASRLEEMPSVIVGAAWLIGHDTMSNFVDPLGSTLRTSCEEIFARLVFSVFSRMMNRFRNALGQRPTSPSLEFAEQLCHFYGSIMVHMCLTGDYTKFSNALLRLLNEGRTEIDECILRACPELALVWFHLLSAIKAKNDSCWKFVSTYGISPTLRRGIIIFHCDRLKELCAIQDDNSDVVESFMSNNSDILDWLDEPPVMEFMSIGLKNQKYCGLIVSKVDAILSEERIVKPTHAIKLLRCLELANFDSSAVVLDVLTRYIIGCNNLAVAKIAGTLALRKLDLLMINRMEDTQKLLSREVLLRLISRIENGKRFGILQSRLEQLLRGWYEQGDTTRPAPDDSLMDTGTSTYQNALPFPSKFNRVKFLNFLQSVSQDANANGGLCAEALCSLSIEDVTEILGDERTPPRLLVSCLAMTYSEYLSSNARNQSPPDKRSKVSEIAVAARRSLIGAIKTVLSSVPKEIRIVFTSRDYSVVGDVKMEIARRVWHLAEAVRKLFENTELKSTLTESELRLFVTYSLVLMAVCLKRLDTIRISQGRRLANVFIAVLSGENFFRILASSEFSEHQLQFIGGAFWLCRKALKMESLVSFVDDLPISVENNAVRSNWQYCDAFLRWLESNNSKSLDLCSCAGRNLLLALCRLPSVASFTHIPPSAFKFGWIPEVKDMNGYHTLPTVPVHYLQNIETLREFIFRVNVLGWSSRQQFEEIWMGLLGVLSATTIGRELLSGGAQEIEDRIVASSFAVRCLAALLLQTLLSPSPGNPLASEYVLRPRERQNTFLKTTFGSKLCELRRRLRRHLNNDRNGISDFMMNPERLLDPGEYWLNQLSVETLWSLTGILAEERDLVSGFPSSPAKRINDSRISDAYEAKSSVETPESVERTRWSEKSTSVSYTDQSSDTPKSPDEFMAVRRSTSNFLLVSESGLDLVSCLHFLLDLFTHWFGGGPDDIPLPLLSSTVETIVCLSDLFTERSQYVWLRERLLAVYQSRSIDDELLLQDVLLGLMKCSAVLGMNDVDKQKEATAFMDIGLHNLQLSVRLCAVHGILYVLQALTSDETISLMPLLTDYVCSHIAIILNGDLMKILEKPQSLDHQLAVWALGFYIMEAFHDQHTKTSFAPKFIELCCKALQSDTLSVAVLDSVVNGVESLLINTFMDTRVVSQLTKLATENVQKPRSPQTAVLAMELLLTCLYTSKENRRFGDATTPDTEIAPRIAGEPHISAMERLTVLLNRVTEGGRFEASAIGSVLPEFLGDHFSPSDVMNKVIIELLSPLQPHPRVLIRTLHSLVEALLQQEVPSVVCDWVLVSLPSFTAKNPAHFSVWALTCLLLSASTNPWVKALWPLAMSRYSASESRLDWQLFCVAVKAFHDQLCEKGQIDTLTKTIAKAAERHPHSAYAKAQTCLLNIGKHNDTSSTGRISEDV